MHDGYELYLIEQMKQATGLKQISQCDYEEWLTKQLKNVQIYAGFLEYIGFSDNLIVEIGKGQSDTIVPTLVKNYHNAIAITPFAHTFTQDLAYFGTLMESPSQIIYGDVRKQTTAPSIYEVGTFITTLSTQSTKQIRAMIATYLRNQTGIIVGAYGSACDKNKWENIATLESIKELLEEYNVSEIEAFHETNQDTYVSVVKSKFKTKELTLSR